MVRRKHLWVQQSDATPEIIEIIGTLFFFKKSTLFGKYRMLPKFSRLGAGSVENYVDELIQFF